MHLPCSIWSSAQCPVSIIAHTASWPGPDYLAGLKRRGRAAVTGREVATGHSGDRRGGGEGGRAECGVGSEPINSLRRDVRGGYWGPSRAIKGHHGLFRGVNTTQTAGCSFPRHLVHSIPYRDATTSGQLLDNLTLSLPHTSNSLRIVLLC